MPRKSTSEYPDNWAEIAEQVKEDADWTCVRCKHAHDPENGYTLTVHHIDISPANCEWWNLAPLCQRCHLTVQGKVDIAQAWMFEHSDWFKPYVAGYYANLYGHPTDRDWVEENIEMLLDYRWSPTRQSSILWQYSTEI